MGQKKHVITIIISSVLAVVLLVFVVIDQLVLLPHAENSISILNSNLAINQDVLKDTENRLNLTTSNLETKEAELGQTQTELVATQDEIVKTETDLANTEQELESTKAELKEAKEDLAAIEESVGALQAEYDEKKDGYDNLLVNIDNLENSYGYGLIDPSYRMMKAFLATDTTNLKTGYSIYETYERARDLKDNAAAKGFRCAVVYLYTPDSGQCCVAFNTSDKGVIYIEPYLDAEVDLSLGESYWDSVAYYVVPPDYDDTVIKIWVMW